MTGDDVVVTSIRMVPRPSIPQDLLENCEFGASNAQIHRYTLFEFAEDDAEREFAEQEKQHLDQMSAQRQKTREAYQAFKREEEKELEMSRNRSVARGAEKQRQKDAAKPIQQLLNTLEERRDMFYEARDQRDREQFVRYFISDVYAFLRTRKEQVVSTALACTNPSDVNPEVDGLFEDRIIKMDASHWDAFPEDEDFNSCFKVLSEQMKTSFPTCNVEMRDLRLRKIAIFNLELASGQIEAIQQQEQRQARAGSLKGRCPICYEDDTLRVGVPCGHAFCLKCTDPNGDSHGFKYLKCPQCKEIVQNMNPVFFDPVSDNDKENN